MSGSIVRSLSILLLAAAVVAAGCRVESFACTAHIQPAIIVTIIDSATGEPRAESASGVARDGTFTDSLRPHAFNGTAMTSRQAAGERPGNYTVTIVAPGYRDWQAAGLRVSRGDCHVQTNSVEARLQSVP